MKAQHHLGTGVGQGGFHRRKAVAPLKVSSVPYRHRRKAVAPLKERPTVLEPMERFPSPKGGGPIEGCYGSIPANYQGCFHRRKAVAPLKEPEGIGVEYCLSCFHRRKAVAPLKGADQVRVLPLIFLFPSPKGGGPIEGCQLPPAVGRLPSMFPSPKGGGPIEGTASSSSRIPPVPVSIAERRWPH